MPHEYDLQGYGTVDEGRLLVGSDLLIAVLQKSSHHSLRVVLISSLRDFADVIASHADLVLSKVHTVAVQAGLQRAEDGVAGWEPDTSVNAMFDLDAARAVFNFCFTRGVRMTVSSRNAVPMLPVSARLARFQSEEPCL